MSMIRCSPMLTRRQAVKLLLASPMLRVAPIAAPVAIKFSYVASVGEEWGQFASDWSPFPRHGFTTIAARHYGKPFSLKAEQG